MDARVYARPSLRALLDYLNEGTKHAVMVNLRRLVDEEESDKDELP